MTTPADLAAWNLAVARARAAYRHDTRCHLCGAHVPVSFNRARARVCDDCKRDREKEKDR